MKSVLAAALGVFVAAAICWPAAAQDTTEKQPVFLLCPYHERYGSWSLYFTVDKNDPSKPLSLGLEELVLKNSKDEGGYEKVIAAQRNPSTKRESVATLDAASFGTGSLRVEKNNALNVTCKPEGEGYSLMIDMRINADGHFVIGGPEAQHRNIILKYDTIQKKWAAYATVLENKDGQNAVSGQPVLVTGLNFPVTSTGIYRIAAALTGGQAVIVYDK